MIRVRPAAERGVADFGWLDSRHSFSFGDYFDPAHMGFRALRVINEDRVEAGKGFGRHPHRDMEILSYVIEGALEHKDSMGNGSVIRPGDVQRMTAGTGVTHSEQNASRTEPVHFLQIWIVPDRRGLAPGYEQKVFSVDDKRDRLRLVASRDGRQGSITVHQDVQLFAAVLSPGVSVEHVVQSGRGLWVQMIDGAVNVEGTTLRAGDGAALTDVSRVVMEALEGSACELLLFDLA